AALRSMTITLSRLMYLYARVSTVLPAPLVASAVLSRCFCNIHHVVPAPAQIQINATTVDRMMTLDAFIGDHSLFMAKEACSSPSSFNARPGSSCHTSGAR